MRSSPTDGVGHSIIIGQVGEFAPRVVPAISPNPVPAISASNQARAHAAGIAGENHFYARDFNRAVLEFKTAVRFAPTHSGHHFRLAYSAWRANELSLVEPHLRIAIECDPQFAGAHDLLSQWYLYSAQYEPALKHSALAMRLAPGDPGIALSRAFVLDGNGDAKGAWELLRPLLDNPTLAERAIVLYLQIATRINRETEACQWALRHLSRNAVPPVERPRLLFALAGVLERLGRFDEAFTQVREARKLLMPYLDNRNHADTVTARIQAFGAEAVRTLPRATHPDTRPIFIVGMPRSGTSLVEQILASHPQVHGAGELEILPAIARRIGGESGTNLPIEIARLNVPAVNQLAAEYLSAINALNRTARFVTDKMPLNFLELGLVQLLFPNSKVIHCVRDPLDTCLSCYMTDIAAGVSFCRDQRALADYFHQYTRIMNHWKQVLTLPILDVRYEDVVKDVKGQSRRMLEFIGLGWDDRCIRFYENRRGVATASREQVRQPVYASSVGRSKHFRAHLAELITLLGGQASA